MNIKEIKNIRELIKLMGESDINEISLEDGEAKLTLKRERAAAQQMVVQAAPQILAAPAPAASAPAAPQASSPAEAPVQDNLHYITAPLVGTFYSSSSPDAPPYVAVGDTVKKGQVLCIIEAMKLMNEIESDVNGTLVEVIPSNASPVDYGARIFAIKPA